MRVTLITGFGLTAASWTPVVERLPLRWDVSVVVPNHGETFTDEAHRLGENGPGIYIGYSMGGRLAISLACQRREIVSGLVVISANAGIRDEREREARAAEDRRRADHVRDVGPKAFFAQWSKLEMFGGVESEAWRQRIDSIETLEHQLCVLGQGRQPALWSQLATISAPALIVAGEDDQPYLAAATEMAGLLVNAELAVAPGGHAVPFEQPRWLAQRIVAFVEAHAGTSAR